MGAYSSTTRRKHKQAMSDEYRRGSKAIAGEWRGVPYDSKHELGWMKLFEALEMPWVRTGAAYEKGLGGWLPDMGLKRDSGGTVYVEVKPNTDRSMFQRVRAKMESAVKINRQQDALLYVERFPDLTRTGEKCRFGWGAVWGPWEGSEPCWLWGDVWLWRDVRRGKYGLVTDVGEELILNRDDGVCGVFA